MYVTFDPYTIGSVFLALCYHAICGFINLYKHDFEVMKYIFVMSCPLVQYQAYNHLALEPATLGLRDYIPDI